MNHCNDTKRSPRWRLTAIGAALTAAALAAPAQAAPTNLSTWTSEGSGSWTVAANNNSVRQNLNGDPAVFYSDFNAFGKRLSGTIRVDTTGDDDYIGFVVGFNPGELSRTGAGGEFYLIDWKQFDQGAFGCNADVGFAVSRVTQGLADSAGAWCHDAEGVTELGRGLTLGSTGWDDLTTYTFDITYTPTLLSVSVNGVLQFSQAGNYSDGRFGFYNYSQSDVIYAGIQDDVLPPPTGGVPEPATWAMLLMGFGAMGYAMRRRREVAARVRFA